MEMDEGMSISYQKLFMVECYAWCMAGCVIEESRGLALANGFALTNGMGRPSRVPRAHLRVRNKKRVDRMDFHPSVGRVENIGPRHRDVLAHVGYRNLVSVVLTS